MKRMNIKVRKEEGIALIEAMVAALLLAIGLIGALGMQAKSTAALGDTNLRADATIAAERLLGVIALDLANAGTYAVDFDGTPGAGMQDWLAATRLQIPNAKVRVAVDAVTVPGRTRVDITIRWERKTGRTADSNVVRHRVISYLAAAA